MTERIRLDGQEFVIDSVDVELVSKYWWSVDGTGQPSTRIINKTTLGQLLLGNPAAKVGFKDGSSSNYTRENLIDRSTGKRRKLALYRNKRVRFRGVTFDKTTNKYKAQINNGFKVVHIGRFSSAEDAALAYDRKALELFGADAVLNFPEGLCTGESGTTTDSGNGSHQSPSTG